MPSGFFITGTDTGVGKTLVAVALTRALVARGLRTAVMKPVAAGAVQTPDGPRNDDALELLAASNVKAAYEDVNPWLLTTPASPHLAARADGVTIRHERIVAAHRRLAAVSDLVLVEGAGGWLAPISATETMADIAGKTGAAGDSRGRHAAGLPQSRVADARSDPRARAAFRRLDREQAGDRNAAGATRISTRFASRFGVAPLAVVPAGDRADGRPAPLRRGPTRPAEKLVSP